MKQKCILVITDGIGHNRSHRHNAYAKAKKRAYSYLKRHSHSTLLRTSGKAVGLPAGQMGNSEVGHMILGSGRVIKQDLVRIDDSIASGELDTLIARMVSTRSAQNYHVIGLYSDGGVHSSHMHLHAVCDALAAQGKAVCAHLISDGRDVLKDSFAGFVEQNLDKFSSRGIKIGSVGGRYYAMDRDKNYDRVQRYIKALQEGISAWHAGGAGAGGAGGENGAGADTKAAISAHNAKVLEYVRSSYARGEYDEMLVPVAITSALGSGGNSAENIASGDNIAILDNHAKLATNEISLDDAFVVINFRSDRARQLCQELGKLTSAQNIITMTCYDEKFDFEVLYAKQTITNTLAQVVSDAGLSQYHTAETEKYAHVSFFFNSREEPYPREERKLIPSPKVPYEQCPQMSAYEVCQSAIYGIQNHDLTIVNFANGDMVGHTGDYRASIKAVEVIDECLQRIISECQRSGCALVLCSDHGNCELMQHKGKIIKNHTTFDVPCYVACDALGGFVRGKLKPHKSLANIAATVLKIMGLAVPEQMSEALF